MSENLRNENNNNQAASAASQSKPATQLPNINSLSLAEEETKDSNVSMMVGSKEDFAKDVRARLQDVELNILEQALLDKFLQDPSTCAKNVLGLLRKLEEKNLDNKFTLKKLRKVIPLFDEHDFWHTQPVPRYYDSVPESDYNAPIETKTVSEVQQEPYALPKGYHWSEINLHEQEQAEELYKLLTDHYVEDSEGKFRFDYSIDFLKWALTPPGQHPEWIVGVRGGQAN